VSTRTKQTLGLSHLHVIEKNTEIRVFE